MQANCFPVQIQFVAVFVIDFCSVSCTGYQQGRDSSSLFITLIGFFMTLATAANKFRQ